MKISEQMSLRIKQAKLILQGLLGMALVAPLGWELLKHGPFGQESVEFRAGFLAFCFVVALGFFLHCRTPDKTEIKPKWW